MGKRTTHESSLIYRPAIIPRSRCKVWTKVTAKPRDPTRETRPVTFVLKQMLKPAPPPTRIPADPAKSAEIAARSRLCGRHSPCADGPKKPAHGECGPQQRASGPGVLRLDGALHCLRRCISAWPTTGYVQQSLDRVPPRGRGRPRSSRHSANRWSAESRLSTLGLASVAGTFHVP